MCGRYTLTTEPNELAAEFKVAEPVRVPARYNIAPSQEAPIIRLNDPMSGQPVPVVRVSESSGRRRMDLLRWGLVPHWAKDEKLSYSTINARAETVATSAAFRGPFKNRRCLVPSNGFYEWQKLDAAGKVKQPHYIRRRDGRPMGFAGLWDAWTGPDGETIESFTIVTTDANEVVRPYHNRMPVILLPQDYDHWLDPRTPVEQLQGLLVPCPPEWLEVVAVSRRVNSPKNDDSRCIDPIP